MTVPRLSAALLAAVPPSPKVARPGYDRAALRPAIVHLGLGAFFRAHGVLYTEDVLNLQGGDWGVIGVSLQRPDQRDRLAPQNAPYRHDSEGPDDMPAHVKTAITGTNLSVPVAEGRMLLGTWQGIYVAEHRARPHRREVVLHFVGALTDR